MFEHIKAKNETNIGDGSNNNIVVQNSQINNPLFISASEDDYMSVIAQCGRYDLVQDRVAKILDAARRSHPLFPDFSAKYDPELGKLVSTPETEDAFRNHPKRINGTYEIDYSRYPHMNRSETPWAYAYRTQTQVEMDTKSYQEFLGEMEDPFPLMTYSEGMTTIIHAPEFPEAVEASILSGNVEIPFKLRRVPCLEYGWLRFGNVSNGLGFDLQISANEQLNKTTVNFKNTSGDSLEAQLLREKLFCNMTQSKNVQINVLGKELVNINVAEKDLQTALFSMAEHLKVFIENLLIIEKHTGCSFCPVLGDVSIDEFNIAKTMVASIQDQWVQSRCTFDNTGRADYNHISRSILDGSGTGYFSAEESDKRVSLRGIMFEVKKSITLYQNARISNFGAVKRSVRQHRKNIRLIIKTANGESHFNKFCKYEEISLVSERS